MPEEDFERFAAVSGLLSNIANPQDNGQFLGDMMQMIQQNRKQKMQQKQVASDIALNQIRGQLIQERTRTAKATADIAEFEVPFTKEGILIDHQAKLAHWDYMNKLRERSQLSFEDNALYLNAVNRRTIQTSGEDAEKKFKQIPIIAEITAGNQIKIKPGTLEALIARNVQGILNDRTDPVTETARLDAYQIAQRHGLVMSEGGHVIGYSEDEGGESIDKQRDFIKAVLPLYKTYFTQLQTEGNLDLMISDIESVAPEAVAEIGIGELVYRLLNTEGVPLEMIAAEVAPKLQLNISPETAKGHLLRGMSASEVKKIEKTPRKRFMGPPRVPF